MRQYIVLFLTLAATAMAAPGPAPGHPDGLSKRASSDNGDSVSRRSNNIISNRGEGDEEDEDEEEWEGTDDGWDTTVGICTPATYDCKPCHTGWLVCDGSGTWVNGGECPESNLCYLDPRNNSPYCVSVSFYEEKAAQGGDA